MALRRKSFDHSSIASRRPLMPAARNGRTHRDRSRAGWTARACDLFERRSVAPHSLGALGIDGSQLKGRNADLGAHCTGSGYSRAINQRVTLSVSKQHHDHLRLSRPRRTARDSTRLRLPATRCVERRCGEHCVVEHRITVDRAARERRIQRVTCSESKQHHDRLRSPLCDARRGIRRV